MIWEESGLILCVHGNCRSPATQENARKQMFCAKHFQAEEYTQDQQEADKAANP